MKKIFNWTIGSFFRTLGRIACYLAIGVLIGFLCVKFNLFSFVRLNALTSDNVTQYDYNDSYVIKNHNSNFFGSSGYLEYIRNSVNSGIILFTKNDIYYVREPSTGNKDFRFAIRSNSSSINISLLNTCGYLQCFGIAKLSDYSNINDFISAIKSGININQRNVYDFTNTTTIDTRYIDFNYFSYANDYLIPYYSFTNLYASSQSLFTYVSSSDVLNNTLSINGTNYSMSSSTTPLLTYYDLFGYGVVLLDIE